jgi:hypothetical protein
MTGQSTDSTGDSKLPRRALSRWDNEGGAAPAGSELHTAAGVSSPESTNVELVALRVRVIALENMMLALLANASERQLDLAREIAAYIAPRPGFTQHPLTLRGAAHMIDLIERSAHFRQPAPQK